MNSSRGVSPVSIIQSIDATKTLTHAVLLLSLQLAGCAVENIIYTLYDPTPPMVAERVHEKDQIRLDVADGSQLKLEVASVDTTSIRGKDGTSIPIADVRQIRCSDTETFGDALWGSTVFTGLLVTSIYWIPVALPIALMQDNEELDRWPDDALCRTLRHPEQYGYSDQGISTLVDEAPTMQEIGDEIQQRNLSCDEIRRAQKRCAFMYDSGPVFTECVSIVVEIEQAGLAEVAEWGDKAVCEAAQNPDFLRSVRLWPTGSEFDAVITSSRQEVDNRKLECNRPLGPPHFVPFN